MGLLRSTGLALHRCFTWQPSLARAYARIWQRSLASLPEGPVKEHLRNNLLGADWPEGAFGVQEIRLCDRLVAKFDPARGSLPYRKGLFRDRLAHEPEVFAFLCARAGTYEAVVEIGANIGAFTVLFGKSLPGARPPRVFSFEPWPPAWRQLQRHVELNGLDNVRIFNRAVGPAGPTTAFYGNEQDWMKGSIDAGMAAEFPGASCQAIDVPVASGAEIERLVRDYTRILVKIDVVGAEGAVIEALDPFLREKVPDLVVGVSRLNRAKLNSLATLRERYELFRIGAEGLVRRDDFSDDAYCNYFLKRR